MVEQITTLTPAQQVAAVQSRETELNRLQVHHMNESQNSFNNSGEKRKNRLTEFEKKLQSTLALTNQSLHISVDEDTKKMVIKIIDNETNEVVRQLPTEEMLRISRSIMETEQRGNLTDERV